MSANTPIRLRVVREGGDVIRDDFDLEAMYAAPAAAEDDPEIDLDDLTGWEPSDLAPFLDGSYDPPQPTVGHRGDGAGLLYPGRVNGLHGPSEAGKSWIALHICAQEIKARHDVIYVDYEDTESGVTDRLLKLGVHPRAIRKRFTYIAPQRSVSDAAREQLAPRLVSASLVVIDAMTEALAAEGLSSRDDVDIAEFYRRLPKWIAQQGPAVLLIDHVVKDVEGHGLGATGSQHKKSAINGASYLVQPGKPMAEGRPDGCSTLFVAKDRLGQVRKHALPGRSANGERFASFTLDASNADSLDAAIEAAVSVEVDSDATDAMCAFAQKRQVMQALKAADKPLSQAALVKAAREINSIDTRAARSRIDELVDQGYIAISEQGQAHLHTFVRMYGTEVEEDS